MVTEIIAQVFGVLGMICNIIVFQQKTQKNVLIWQFFAATTFALNYFLLGAMVGGMLNTVGAIRSVVFFFKDKTKANHLAWLIVFICAFVASYPLSFFVFGKEQTPLNFVIEVLPVVAMIIATISLRLGSAKAVRSLGLISSPLWLTYNCFSGSFGAIASEILNLISIIVGIIRLDIKKKQPTKEQNTEKTE
ncbi:MAG: YgjV family protein [Clostridia bacterium]|nr:YgjV family protein [Clostridia bacterium]